MFYKDKQLRKVIQGFQGGETEVVVCWVHPPSLVVGNQRFGSYAASIFRVEVLIPRRGIYCIVTCLEIFLMRNSRFDPQGGGSTNLRNVGFQPPNYTAQQPRKPPLQLRNVFQFGSPDMEVYINREY
jgi:hypothetical protein